jgi:hypothetical protein
MKICSTVVELLHAIHKWTDKYGEANGSSFVTGIKWNFDLHLLAKLIDLCGTKSIFSIHFGVDHPIRNCT